MRWLNSPDALHIHDDLLSYINDTLKWIVCYNPANKMEKLIGLNWYGPSVIKQDGARLLKQIFENWASLFASGPPILNLTGNYTWTPERQQWACEVLEFDRDQTVKMFRTLASFAKRIADSNDELFLLHLGV
jgi:hypothetical protein